MRISVIKSYSERKGSREGSFTCIWNPRTIEIMHLQKEIRKDNACRQIHFPLQELQAYLK